MSAYPAAAAALADAFDRRTLRRSAGTTTERCGLTPRSGGTREDERVEAERGAYTLRIPAASTVRLDAGETVTIDEEPGRVWRVVWTPPMGNLGLSRQYGVDEVI